MNDNRVSHPNLRKLTTRLAGDNRKVGRVIEGIFEYIESLDDASQRSDWHEVRRLAELIFVDSLTYGYPELADAADQIVHASTASVCLADIEQPLDDLKQAGSSDAEIKRGIRQPRRRR